MASCDAGTTSSSDQFLSPVLVLAAADPSRCVPWWICPPSSIVYLTRDFISDISDYIYISPEAMATCLAALLDLEILRS